MKKLQKTLLATSLLAIAGVAFAQESPQATDPQADQSADTAPAKWHTAEYSPAWYEYFDSWASYIDQEGGDPSLYDYLTDTVERFDENEAAIENNFNAIKANELGIQQNRAAVEGLAGLTARGFARADENFELQAEQIKNLEEAQDDLIETVSEHAEEIQTNRDAITINHDHINSLAKEINQDREGILNNAINIELLNIRKAEATNVYSKAEADKKFALKSELTPAGTIDTSEFAKAKDLANKADKSELAGKADKTELTKKADKGEAYTKAEADAKFALINAAPAAAINTSNLATKADVAKLEKSTKQGMATQAALAGLFQPYNIGKVNLSAALGGYKSESAIAIGAGYRYNEQLAGKIGVATNSGGTAYNIGVNYEF
ncbi:YadA-like family protein [Moraxella nasovis]|uniref:YadA C-terminal domain-containing protein n=1 Tax=Moraxella nasovis TaxID=2904121 RepID=UPI001F609913|nr:YadA C-terminal domain-containing protein [Moraxella nasovis]UNU73077.1 YadA-like family protein [Moraxella nasovis]